MKKFLATILLGLIASSKAMAILYLEPMVGYNLLGKMTVDPNFEYEYDGPVYGLRIGGSVSYLSFGAQLEKSKFELVQTAPAGALSASQTKQDYETTHLGIFLRFKLPMMFSFWGTYFFKSQFEVAEAPGLGNVYNGSGYSLGVGYNIVPMLSLNAQLNVLEYDELETSTGTTSTISNALNVQEMLLTISVPLSL